jgi:cob(I)alamin adenosyltransferase
MGNRLSKIYTRTGDTGTTGLGDGTRVSKDGSRVDAIGDLDELNSLIGLLVSMEKDDPISASLIDIQHDLFDLGGELSIPGTAILGSANTERLERQLDDWNEEMPTLKEFILPGGTSSAAVCHLARAVCRRGERTMVTLNREKSVNDAALTYINRLSDLLFVLARRLARRDDGEEVFWDRSRRG